jgi:ABC-type multidrug transport system permease subunit
VVFLLVFTSAAFVPATAMPGWLQAFGTHQPVDALVNAERALILGGQAAHDVLISLAWSGGMLAVFVLLAARTYARMGRLRFAGVNRRSAGRVRELVQG